MYATVKRLSRGDIKEFGRFKFGDVKFSFSFLGILFIINKLNKYAFIYSFYLK